MKRVFATVLCCFFSFTVLANDLATQIPDQQTFLEEFNLDFQSVNDGKPIKTKIKEARAFVEQVGAENTCLDEYLKRRRNLIIGSSLGTVWGPGTVAVAGAGGFAIGYGAAVTGSYGLGGIFLPIVGMYLGGFVGLAAFLGVETALIVNLLQINSQIKLVYQSHLGQGNKLERFTSKLNKKTESIVAADQIAAMIVEADTKGMLCDGSLRKKKGKKSLRKRLAKKRHLKNYILNQL
jgi:hypothetical protein